MKALIAFEESQAVTIEFRKRGIETYSNDLKVCSGGHPEWHLQMDCFDAMNLQEWDFIGLHPTCTKMTLSGNRSYAPGKERHNERLEAVEWTIGVWNYACKIAKFVYMENPMGAMNTDKRLPKPQIIQPYYFGDAAMKTTCLWLKNLPFLHHIKEVNLFDTTITHTDKGKFYEWTDRKTGKLKRQNLEYAQAKGFGGKAANDVSELRSKTYPGIARAMAEQWGPLL